MAHELLEVNEIKHTDILQSMLLRIDMKKLKDILKEANFSRTKSSRLATNHTLAINALRKLSDASEEITDLAKYLADTALDMKRGASLMQNRINVATGRLKAEPIVSWDAEVEDIARMIKSALDLLDGLQTNLDNIKQEATLDDIQSTGAAFPGA